MCYLKSLYVTPQTVGHPKIHCFSSQIVACSAGSYFKDNACVSCAKGQYQQATNTTNCKLCESGKFADGMSSTACAGEACAAGKYGNAGSSSSFSNTSEPCTECAVGQFQMGTGATSCALCVLGQYTVGAGARGCTLCAPGQYADTAGLAACKGIACPAGKEGPLGMTVPATDASIGKNVGKDCWRFCSYRQGDCDGYCGTGGTCCKRGWVGGSCSGSEGGIKGHRCVAGEAITACADCIAGRVGTQTGLCR